MTLEFNHRAAIAAAVEDLSKDLDIPVYVEGDLWLGKSFSNMDKGEAARIVVDVVLDHPIVQQAIDEAEQYWEVIKWMVVDAGINPETPSEFLPILLAAFEAAVNIPPDAGDVLDTQ